MNAVTMLLHDASVVRLGSALLHFAWQGAAGALLAGVLLVALRRASAAERYVALLVVFGAMAICPVITLLALAGGESAPASSPAVSARIEPQQPARLASGVTAPMSNAAPLTAAPPRAGAPVSTPLLGAALAWVEPRLGWLAAVWAVGVVALSLRLALGWTTLGRSRRAAEELVEGGWTQLLTALSQRLRISRPVRLLQSAAQQTPLVMGWLRPVILLPSAAMTGLTSAQVEAILAHELAHIRRHDYAINLAQTVIETLLFYHPAVWWLSSRIRAEREHCCDDLAVEVCGDPVGYARALAELEELRTAPRPALAAGGSLLHRVRRLARASEPRVDVRASWLSAGIVLALLLGLGMTGHLARVAAETAAPANALAAAQEAFDSGKEAAARSANGEAIEHFDEALRLLGEAGEGEAAKRLRVEVLSAKADAVQFARGFEDSLTYLLQALSLSEELEDPAERARRTSAIGVAYANAGQKEKAEEYYRKAAELFREAGDAAGEGECFFWLASSQLSDGEVAGGRRDLDQALPLLQQGETYALAAACEAGRELLDSLGDGPLDDLADWAMDGTVLVAADARVSFTGEPGFSQRSAGVGSLAVRNPFWQISRLKAFLDESVGVGESWSGEAFSYTYQPLRATVTVKSKSEQVTVPAGTFDNCLLTEQVTTESDLPDDAPDRKKELNRSTFVGTRRAWYAPGVGLVRLEVERGDGVKATIELREYTIAGGGKSSLPLDIANTWTYGWAGVPLDSAREVYRVTAHEGDTWYLAHYERIRQQVPETAEAPADPLSTRVGVYGEDAPRANDDEAPSSPESDDIREHVALVITPDKIIHVAAEDLPVVLNRLAKLPPAAGPRPDAIDIDVHDVSIEHVLRIVSSQLGVTIVVEEGVEEPITLKANLSPDPEAVLDAICAAKGLQWQRESSGAYIVSTRAKPGAE